MKVFVVSKGSVLRSYREKWERMAREPDLELTLLLPERWGKVTAEVEGNHACKIFLEKTVLVGKNHLHFYPFLGKRLRKARPDVLHIDEEPYSFVTFQVMSWKGRSKALFFTWQNIVNSYPPPFRWFERYNYRRADAAMAASSEAGTVLREKGFGKKIFISPQYGVDPGTFKKREERTLREKLVGGPAFVIGYIGRFVPEKGVSTLLHAATALGKDCRAVLLGNGPLEGELRRLAITIGIGERVLFLRNVPSFEVHRYLNCLDVLVLPSRTTLTWKEQLGRILIEAMACEIPVVGSNSGEIPNVIGEAGLVFPEGDSAELIRALTWLRNNPSERINLGIKGRERVLKHFTHEKVAAQTLAAYRQILM